MKIPWRIQIMCCLLGIKVKYTNKTKCQWKNGNEILIGYNWTPYKVLHEIGHAVCGWSCCREHAEFEAHGVARLLCKLLGFDDKEGRELMNPYAGRSAHCACGRIMQQANEKQKAKERSADQVRFGSPTASFLVRHCDDALPLIALSPTKNRSNR